MIDRKQFRQCALIISMIASALLVFSRIDPFYPRLGVSGACFSFLLALAPAWIILAIFRNVHVPKGLRAVLLLVPIFFIAGALASPLLFHGISCRGAISTIIFIPLAGLWPRTGKNIKWEILSFMILTLGWVTIDFLMGYQAGEAGYGIAISRVSILFNNLLLAGAVYSLIALSSSRSLSPFFEKTWVKRGCVIWCILAAFIYLICISFHCYFNINDKELGWGRMMWYCPLVWYALYCMFRFFRELFSRRINWKAVFFDREQQ